MLPAGGSLFQPILLQGPGPTATQWEGGREGNFAALIQYPIWRGKSLKHIKDQLSTSGREEPRHMSMEKEPVKIRSQTIILSLKCLCLEELSCMFF